MYRKSTRIALLTATFTGSLILASNVAYAQDPRVVIYLQSVRQNLDLTISNAESLCQLPDDSGITCNGAKASVCQTALISLASLQDLINQGALSTESGTYQYVGSVAESYCPN
jgi:hypothetical protein